MHPHYEHYLSRFSVTRYQSLKIPSHEYYETHKWNLDCSVKKILTMTLRVLFLKIKHQFFHLFYWIHCARADSYILSHKTLAKCDIY